MKEDLESEAVEELKRADHLIYVTLKYTKTCDVIKNIIQRLINAFDFKIIEILNRAKENKIIDEIPSSVKKRCEVLCEIFPEKIKKYIDFYLLLRKIDKADYDRKDEYRKNIALIVLDEDGNSFVEVDIDTLKKYFNKTQKFLEFVSKWEGS